MAPAGVSTWRPPAHFGTPLPPPTQLASIADAEEMPSPPSFPYPSLLVPVLLLLLLLLFLLCMSFILLLLAAAAED